MDEKVPCLVLSYATRINAEQAVSRGRQFKDKTLNVIVYIFFFKLNFLYFIQLYF